MIPLLLAILPASAVQSPLSRPLEPYDLRGYPYFGSIVGRAGDVDGDGMPDIVVGDRASSHEGSPPMIWVLSGKDGRVLRRTPLPVDRSQPTGFQDFALDGGVDLDGDHVPDLALAVRTSDPGYAATLWILSGSSGEIRASRAIRTHGHSSSGWLRIVQDRNGDSMCDLAVLDPGHEERHAAIVFYSGSSGEPIRTLPFENIGATSVGSFLEVPARGSKSPASFAVLLETDEDGRVAPRSTLELLSDQGSRVWQRPWPRGQYGTNAVLALLAGTDFVAAHENTVDVVRDASAEARLHFVAKSEEGEGFGCSLASPGDLDRDGAPDLVYGIYDPGLYEGAVVARSGKDGRQLWRVEGDFGENVHHLGYRIGVVGDLDGDGAADLVLGTMEGPDGTAHGLAQVVSGRDGSLLFLFRRQLDSVFVEHHPVNKLR
ncbi:MAG: VCBS repeat-containing protein [Planctomycetes bacterium]|nr:VCBS repeat-containing protein [Planctomycetota bacterium]